MRKLTTEQQEIIVQAANEAAVYINKLIDEQENEVKEALVDVQIIDGSNYLNDEIIDYWKNHHSKEVDAWLELIRKAIIEGGLNE